MTESANPEEDPAVVAASLEQTLEDAEGGVEGSLLDAPDDEDGAAPSDAEG
jgi:hypothetical protein